MSDEVILTSDKNESNTQETKSFLSKIKIMLKSDRFKKIIIKCQQQYIIKMDRNS